MKIQRLMLAALAVCGTTAAMAQSSVTIYGRVNTTIERQKVGDESVTGMFNNSSRIGFKGVEDLGGGLKAGFILESGFASDTGAGLQGFQRQSELNLSGNFGMLRLGNFDAESYYATADFISMHNHDTGSSADALYDYNMRTANKIAYRTPDMGGFWAEVQHSFHEKAPGERNAWDFAANYNAGALGLGAGYSQVGDDKQAGLRASYAMGPVTLGAYYQRSDKEVLGTRNNFRLSAMYAMGASEFHANVGRANKWSEVADSASTQWTLGYNYNLSKRTKVYGYYTKVNNKAAGTYMTGTPGVDFSSFAAGVRHNF